MTPSPRDRLTTLLGPLPDSAPAATPPPAPPPGLTRTEQVAARLDFDAYCRAVVPRVIGETYRDGWFLRELRAKLARFAEDVLARRSPRLVIMAPPRHGKSLHLELLVSWLMGCVTPGRKFEVMVVGATKEIALDRVSNARSYFALGAELGLNTTDLDPSFTAKGKWATAGKGSVYAAGVKGTLTSKGADLFVIDDPVKGIEDVLSPTQRDAAWRGYTANARSRVQSGGGLVIIQTRWHEDDLTGRLLDQHAEAEGWEVIRYPAIAEEDEPHRLKGEALHPELWPLERLEQRRATSLTQDWLAQYQQRPTSEEGSVWLRSWWRRWTAQPTPDSADRRLPDAFDRVVVSCDLTMGSQSGAGSFGVAQVWGQVADCLYLLTEERGRWGFEESVGIIEALARDWHARACLIEAKALGISALQTLRGRVAGLVAVDADGSKQMRAYDAAVHVEQGRVYLPSPIDAPWIDEWLDEVTGFPTARYDDRVDAASQAIRSLLTPRRRGVVATGKVR